MRTLLHILLLSLVLGLPAGLLLAHLRMQVYSDTRDTFVPLLVTCLEDGVQWTFLAVVLWGLVYRVLRTVSQNSVMSSVVTTLAIGVFPACWYIYYVNVFHLPDLREWDSYLGNGGMLVAGSLLLWGISKMLRSWQEGAWQLGGWTALLTLVLAMVPLAGHWLGHASREDDSVDVLVLMVGSLRADRLSCYGYQRRTSPCIDQLAADGVLFEQAIASSTLAKASVASVFTGLAPHKHGVLRGTITEDHHPEILAEVLGQEQFTLAEAMFDSGLNTVGWVTHSQLRGYLGFSQGFSLYIDHAGWIATFRDRFRRWMGEWAERKRFFAFLHFMDMRGLSDGAPLERVAESPPKAALGSSADIPVREAPMDLPAGGHPRPENPVRALDLERGLQRYDRRVAHTDRWIGRILDDLRESGRYDKTLIILTSDQGMELGGREMLGDTELPYEELVRVPLIVKLPGSQRAGHRVSIPVGHTDLAPTLLEFIGAEAPEGLDGQSLMPLLMGSEEAGPAWDQRMLLIESVGSVALRTDRWKYIEGAPGEVRLYDLEKDPRELEECARLYPEVRKKFAARVNRIREERRSRRLAVTVPVDLNVLKDLRAMGYL